MSRGHLLVELLTSRLQRHLRGVLGLRCSPSCAHITRFRRRLFGRQWDDRFRCDAAGIGGLFGFFFNRTRGLLFLVCYLGGNLTLRRIDFIAVFELVGFFQGIGSNGSNLLHQRCLEGGSIKLSRLLLVHHLNLLILRFALYLIRWRFCSRLRLSCLSFGGRMSFLPLRYTLSLVNNCLKCGV